MFFGSLMKLLGSYLFTPAGSFVKYLLVKTKQMINLAKGEKISPRSFDKVIL